MTDVAESLPMRGRWWLVGRGERRISGVLRRDQFPGTLTLELDGTATVTSHRLPTQLAGELPTILGRTIENRKVTLCDNRNTGRRQTGLGAQAKASDTVSARFGFVGDHFPEGPETTFSSYTFRTTHLGEWASKGYLTGTDEYITDELGGILRQSIRFPKPVELKLPWGGVSIHYGWEQSSGVEEATIRRPVSWQLDLDVPQTVDVITDRYLWPLSQFLSFACDGGVVVDEVAAQVARRGPIGLAEIAVLRPPRPAPSLHAPRGRFEMLFSLADVEDRLESMLCTWFERFDLLRSSLDLLFGLVLGPEMYLESRFLLVAQGMEVFHRRRHAGVAEPVEEWKERIGRITAELSKTDAAWVIENLHWSNELTLHQRIEELLAAVQSTASRFLRQDFIKVFKATRNYYTHFDKRQYKNAAHGEDLHWLTEECFALMQLVLLNELGVAESESWAWMRRTQRVISLAGRLSR